ncbi:hypothetical protein MLD38_017696 [Melastoma candidum]|uniref:Uncharacterized protein n=1 Tax=Melastoma candidum TaxID=119954 RepID=A0ACB9QVJ1_9MYRT|nr:hypothetical protein MLD38_017696 [Melastoma candidum]
MEMEAIGELALHMVMEKLGPKNVGRVACVSRKLRDCAAEETLWSKFCLEELGISSPVGPGGDPTPSFKVAYQEWRESFEMYPWPLVLRVKRCWDKLSDWLSKNFPEAEATLRKGASEAELKEAETVLQVKLPLPTRVLYRFHDGQDSVDDPKSSFGRTIGIIGGYSFYHHVVNVKLLPLEEVILKTHHIRKHLGGFSRSRCIVVATSCTTGEKLFFINCRDGQLHVGTINFPTEAEMMPCVPSELLRLTPDSAGHMQDAMLLWLEEHVRRLEMGIIKPRGQGKFKSICQYPEESPLCSTAITHGVRVRGSAVFVPEFSDPNDDTEQCQFAYSIRMSLLPEGCTVSRPPFNSCQLNWRYWTIRSGDAVVSDFNGEAVIGQFPLLHAGGEEFVYESCAYLPSGIGSIEGSFTFIPGRLVEPKGGPFSAQVAQFPFRRPDYIF